MLGQQSVTLLAGAQPLDQLQHGDAIPGRNHQQHRSGAPSARWVTDAAGQDDRRKHHERRAGDPQPHLRAVTSQRCPDHRQQHERAVAGGLADAVAQQRDGDEKRDDRSAATRCEGSRRRRPTSATPTMACSTKAMSTSATLIRESRSSVTRSR